MSAPAFCHEGYRKTYAEKLILDPLHQKPPQHFHKGKIEDIINRGGGSICIPPRTVHQFWGDPGTGGVLVNSVEYTVSGEVSSVCDDWNDNFWLEPCERFCKIEEDEPRKHYLVHEYPSTV